MAQPALADGIRGMFHTLIFARLSLSVTHSPIHTFYDDRASCLCCHIPQSQPSHLAPPPLGSKQTPAEMCAAADDNDGASKGRLIVSATLNHLAKVWFWEASNRNARR